MPASRVLAMAGFIAMAMATLPAAAAGPFDGTYAGTNTFTGAGDAGCSPSGTITKVVTDSSFVQKWANTDVRATIGADGTIDGSANVGGRNGALVTIKGKIAGTVMTYDITSQRCSYHVQATKR